MRRFLFLAAVMAVTGTAFIRGSAQFRIGAQTGTPAATHQGFVGA